MAPTSPRRRGAPALVVALTLAGSLVAAACSSSSTPSTGGPGSTAGGSVPATAPGSTPPGTRATSPGSVPARSITLDAAKEAALTRAIDARMAEFGIPGADVLVMTPDARWEHVAGVRDLETKAPMEEKLRWPLRSVTKSYTVTLILQLVDEGVLSFDDTVGDWLDGVPQGDRITLLQLADMTSGLPEYTTKAFIDDFMADPRRVFTVDELLAYAFAEPMQFEPGARRVYTNTNTLVLGRVVEEATGKPFVDVLGERILGPLGLEQTVYPTAVDQWAEDVTGYQPDDGALAAQPVNYSVFGPAGALIATVDDLAAWGTALGSGELLEPATQAVREQGGVLDKGPDYDLYASGIGEVSGWWGHTGEGFGITVLTMHDPASGATVAIAMNASGLGEHVPTVLFRDLAAILAA